MGKSQSYFIVLLYLLFVVVITSCGVGSSEVGIGGSTTEPLNSPINVTCTVGTNFVTINWDKVSNAESYNIYYNTTGGVTTSDNKVSDVTPQFTHTGLINDTTYYYVVTAVTSGGEGSPSIEVSATTLAFKLPDTGQMQSYTLEFGEDSDYTINPPSYIFDGEDTIIDNNTGLMWHISAKEGTWDEAVHYCETLTFDGYSDWALPSKKELIYIADYDKFSSYYYWSSTSNAFNSVYAWVVNLPGGSSSTKNKLDSNRVRCVRNYQDAGQSFVDNGDETVTDYNTGLMWQQQYICEDFFEPALSHCENLTLSGYNDWRLPNIKELASIVDYTKYWPAIDTAYFPGTHSMTYWSSTTDVASPGDIWHVDFDIGSIYTRPKSSEGSKYVRCVRSIQ